MSISLISQLHYIYTYQNSAIGIYVFLNLLNTNLVCHKICLKLLSRRKLEKH